MTRKECLDKAAECVLKDRQNVYGKPEDCFGMIARMWSAYIGVLVSAHDVAAMMALLKIARIKASPAHADNWCDLAGYAACGAECRQKFETEIKKTAEDAFETFPHLKPEAEGGCCQNGNDQQEFKPGDAVDWYSFGARGMEPGWHSAVYLRNAEDPDYCVVREPDGRERIVDRRYLRRPEAKAEGCEALVEKDAPQTTQELYDRILSCNPATYGKQSTPEGGMAEIHRRLMMGENVSLKCPAPRKPTGEELAEMAEEEPHG